MKNNDIFTEVKKTVHQISLANELKETINYEVEKFNDKIFEAAQMNIDLFYSGNNILEVSKHNTLKIQNGSEKILQEKILHLAKVLKKDIIFHGQLERMREYKNHFNCEYIEEIFADERPVIGTNDIIEIKEKIQELGYEPNSLNEDIAIYLYVDGNLADYLEKHVLSCYENNPNTVEEYKEIKEFINKIKEEKSGENLIKDQEEITIKDFLNCQFGRKKSDNYFECDKIFDLKRNLKDYDFFNLNETTFNKFNFFDDDGIALTYVSELAQHFDKDDISKKVDKYNFVCHQAIATYCDECISKNELLDIITTLKKNYDGTYSFDEQEELTSERRR